MTDKEIEVFLKIQPQLKSSYDEIGILSKKKPTESLNKFKLKLINNIIQKANLILGDSYMPFGDEFKLFEEADLPNNGDVVFILSHYLTALEKLRCDNIEYDTFDWYWKTSKGRTNQKTNPPTI